MENRNPMEYKPVFPLLMSMAIPPMISMLIQSLYNIIDSIFVSQLGEEALTAVSLIFPLQNLSLAISCGIGIAMNAFIARHLGAKDDNKASVTGTGRFNLNYGTNTYRVNVTAENGSTRTYTININREDTRSSNNNLKSLTLSKGNLNFNKSTTTYNVDVDKDTTSVKIEASLEDVKASFENGFGPRTINLNPGNNTIYIKVRNEIRGSHHR